MRRLVLALTATLLLCTPAHADWNGDGPGDVLAIHPDGRLLLYAGNGSGGWAPGVPQTIGGGGWGAFSALMAPGDFSGDGKADLLVRNGSQLLMYRGNGTGTWATGVGQPVGSGWQDFTALLTPGDFSGDGRPDVLARQPDGTLLMYRGDGDGGWLTGSGERIGAGWQSFGAIIPGGDFSGDGKPDVLAVRPDGVLVMYRGNGAGGWATGSAEPIGSGWTFTALASGGDFSGDGKPDVLARAPDGTLLLYRGNGAGGWILGRGEPIGSGWNGLGHLTLAGATPPPAPAPPEPPAPPAAPLPDGNVRLNAGIRCTPPGGLLRVSLSVRKRRGRPAPRVQRIVFFVRNGPRRTDRKRPYTVRLRMHRAAGTKGRVYARVYFKRPGSKKLRTKTVSRRYVMCG